MTRTTLLILSLFLVAAPAALAQGEDPPPKPAEPTSLDIGWDDRKVPENAEEAKKQLARVEAALAGVNAEEKKELHEQLTAQKDTLDALVKIFEQKPIEERKAELERRKGELDIEVKRLGDELGKPVAIGSGPVDDTEWSASESRKIEAETEWNSAITRAHSAAQNRATVGERATNQENQLRALQQEETAAESDRVTKSDPTVAADVRMLATEKAWALRLQVQLRQLQLSALKRRQALGLPDIEVAVAELEKEVATQRKKLADDAHDRLAQQRKQWTVQQARVARTDLRKIEEQLAAGAGPDRPFLELRLDQLRLKTQELEWTGKLEQRERIGPVRKGLDRARETEIEIQREMRGEQLLPRDAGALRIRVGEARERVVIARAKRTEMRDERIAAQRVRDALPARSQSDDRVENARKEWKASGGESAPNPISEAEWTQLGADYKAAVEGVHSVLKLYLESVNRLDGDAQALSELASRNLAFLQDRLVWTREESDISLEAVRQTADDAAREFDRLGDLPGRIWSYVRAFIDSEPTKAIIGAALIAVMLLVLLFAHKRLPQSYSYFDEQTGVAHAIGTILRRTDFTFTVAVVFVGIPWAIGLTRDSIVAVAAVFASPFIYRFGRVMADILFAPESEADRIVRIEDGLAHLFHVTTKTLLNLTAVFIPVRILMDFAGYDDVNHGFHQLWELAFDVLVLLVLLFTVFRPAVIGRLIRGDGVIASSVKSWILILYPLIVGALVFLFVLSALQYVEAERFFRALFLKSAGLLLGGYIVYRVALRQFLKGRKIETLKSSDDYDQEAEFFAAGQRHFADTTVRWTLRAAFLLPTAFLLARTWEAVDFGIVDEQDHGVTTLSVFLSVLAIFTTSVVTRTVKNCLTFVILPRSELDRGMRYTVVTIATYVLWAIGLVVALNLLRVDGTQITMVVSALMFGLGFGLQSIVKNFVSGLILLAERPVKVGDRVQVGESSGVVEKITLRATTVMTWEGVGIVIPNEEMIGGTLTNQSLGQPRLRTDLAFGVAYGSEVQNVRDLVMGVVKDHGLVLKRPGPEVFFMGFGNSSLDFEVRYWTMLTTHRLRVVSDLRYAIEAAFAREGVEIPFPQRDLNLRMVDPVAAASLRGGAGPIAPAESSPRPTEETAEAGGD